MVSLNSNLYLWRITIYGSVFLWKDQMTWFLKKHRTEHKPTDLSVTRGAVLIPRTQHSLHSIKLSWLIRGQLKNCMKNCTKCIAINWVFEFTWVDSKYRFLFGLSTCRIAQFDFFFHHLVIKEVFMLRLSARIWISGRWKLN